MNLTKIKLTDAEKKVLSEGLKFCPVPSKKVTHITKCLFEEYTTRVKKEYFFNSRKKPGEPPAPRLPFILKSDWEPPEHKITDDLIAELEYMEETIDNICMVTKEKNLIQRNPEIPNNQVSPHLLHQHQFWGCLYTTIQSTSSLWLHLQHAETDQKGYPTADQQSSLKDKGAKQIIYGISPWAHNRVQGIQMWFQMWNMPCNGNRVIIHIHKHWKAIPYPLQHDLQNQGNHLSHNMQKV